MTNSAKHQPGRRAFIGAASSIAAGTIALGKLSRAAAADGDTAGVTDAVARQSPPEAGNALPLDRSLKRHALSVRVEAARQQYAQPIAAHPTNGDEARYPSKIGSDTRGLPHDERGEVDPAAWGIAEKAYASRSWADFENIPLGGTRKFVNPIGTLAPSLEGANVTQLAAPPAPEIAGEVRAAEAVEQYWQALLRDESFAGLEESEAAAAAAEELSGLAGYRGPRVDGKVTPASLFRGSVTYADPKDRSARTALHVIPPGVLDGPYVSQFAFRDTPYGTQRIAAVGRVPVAGQDFLIEHDEWLAIQDGVAAARTIQFVETPRHVHTLRDLNEYTHGGNPLFWAAALQLGAAAPSGFGAPVSPTNPYATSKTQASGNGTFALGYLQGLLTTGVSRAIRAVYWQKWFVHRSVRPEAFGGLVRARVADGVSEYPIHADLLDSEALARATAKFGTQLIPQAYPEGAPLHGSYPAGSAAIAGVSATLLKAYFDESFVLANPVLPDPADPTKLVPYAGGPLTVGGELNKLALNYTFGRVLSGIHWRSDSAAGLALGEQIALSILQDERLTFAEPFAGFKLTKFDGTTVTI